MTKTQLNLCGKIAVIAGIVSVCAYLAHDLIGAMNYPGYDWMRQAVSDLTATDAPSFIIASGIASIYKIFACVACFFAWVLFQETNQLLKRGVSLFTLMNLISAVGYLLFPLTGAGNDGSMQSIIHIYVITILVVLLSILSLVMIARGAFKEQLKRLGILALVALILMFAGAIGSGLVPADFFGVVERLSTYSAVVYTAVLGYDSSKVHNK